MDSPVKNNKSFGACGEAAAADYLRGIGIQIAAVNFRFCKMGEIDIICMDREYICFIEVKTRSSSLYGLPCEAVTGQKQRNIYRLAQVYLMQNRLNGAKIRFDVVEVYADRRNDQFKLININHIKNAF